MTVLGISYYDPYSGIEIEGEHINVTTGHYPFIEGQKLLNKKTKLIVQEFVYLKTPPHTPCKYVTDVIFKEIISGNIKTIPILQVLKSLKEGRTKFSL